MKYTIKKTQSFFYTGRNHDDVHYFFKGYEKEWNFKTTLFTSHNGSYDDFKKGIINADLIFDYGTKRKPVVIPFKRNLSFSMLNDGEIILNIDFR